MTRDPASPHGSLLRRGRRYRHTRAMQIPHQLGNPLEGLGIEMVAHIALPIAPHQVRQELTGVAQLAERMP